MDIWICLVKQPCLDSLSALLMFSHLSGCGVMLRKIIKWIDEFYYLVSLQVALLLVTCLDYIVHTWLYDYGLQFSYSWALPYWTILTLIFITLAFVSASAYNIDRKRKFIHITIPPKKRKIIAVFSTILIEYFAGFLDTIFMGIRALFGHGVNWTGNWWWSPFSWILSHWDLQRNIALNLVGLIILCIVWIWANRKP